jgi:hypothetical protein
MQEKSKRSLVFAVVAVLTLGSTIAGAGLGRGASGKLAETRGRLLPPLPPPPPGNAASAVTPAVPQYRIALQDLEMAKLGASSGRREVEASALVRVLERADRIDRGRSLVASLVAAKLFDAVGERVAADPALLDDDGLVAALRRTSFGSSRRPLEAERRHAINVLAGVPAQVPFRTAGFAESTATHAMEDVSAALHEMEDSALAGDVQQCEAAAAKPKGLAKQVTVGPSICKSALRVAESGRRLRSLQARATAHARRGAPPAAAKGIDAKTARATVRL